MSVRSAGAARAGAVRVAAVGVVTLLASSQAFAASYSWSQTGAGPYNWNNAGGQNNWNTTPAGGFPGGAGAAGDVANILTNIAATQSIDLNQAITLGVLNIGDTTASSGAYADYQLNPGAPGTAGSLTFDNNTATAQLNFVVTSGGNTGSNTIAAPVFLAGDLDVTSAADALSRTQTFSAAISASAATGYQTLSLSGTGLGANYAIAAINNGTTGGTVNAVFNTGLGIATLAGASDYTGYTLVRSGETTLTGGASIFNTSGIYLRGAALTLGAPTSAVSSNRVADDEIVRLSGGTLNLLGTDSAATSETLGELRFETGLSTIQVSNGASSTATLTAGAFTRDSSAIGTRGNGVVYSGATGNPLGGASKLLLAAGATAPTLLGGDGSSAFRKKIVPYLMTQTGFVKAGRANNLLTYDPASGFVPLNLSTDYRTSIDNADPGSATTGYDNVRIAPFGTATITQNVGGSKTINALLYDNAVSSSTFNTNLYTVNLTGLTLTVASGVVMVGSTNSAAPASKARLSLSEGTLAFGAAEGQLMIGAANGSSTNISELMITSSITGTGGLTASAVTSTNHFILGGDNTGLTGPLTVNSGELYLQTAKAVSTSTTARVRSGAILRSDVSPVVATPTLAAVEGAGTIALSAAGTALNIGGDGTGGVAGRISTLGGAISPGDFAALRPDGTLDPHSTGTLNFKNVATTSSQNLALYLTSGTLNIDIDSPTSYDSLALTVAGSGTSAPSVVINGGSTSTAGNTMNLVVNLGYAPALHEKFKIIDVSKSTLISGVFAQGNTIIAFFSGSNYTFTVDYNNGILGDGNDMVLEMTGSTVVPEPGALALAGFGAWGLVRRRRHITTAR